MKKKKKKYFLKTPTFLIRLLVKLSFKNPLKNLPDLPIVNIF